MEDPTNHEEIRTEQDAKNRALWVIESFGCSVDTGTPYSTAAEAKVTAGDRILEDYMQDLDNYNNSDGDTSWEELEHLGQQLTAHDWISHLSRQEESQIDPINFALLYDQSENPTIMGVSQETYNAVAEGEINYVNQALEHGEVSTQGMNLNDIGLHLEPERAT